MVCNEDHTGRSRAKSLGVKKNPWFGSALSAGDLWKRDASTAGGKPSEMVKLFSELCRTTDGIFHTDTSHFPVPE